MYTMAEVKGKERSTIVHVKVLIILSRMTKQLICTGIEATVIKKYRDSLGQVIWFFFFFFKLYGSNFTSVALFTTCL